MNSHNHIGSEGALKRACAAQVLILGAAAAGVLLCGGMPQGSLGIFLLAAAACLVLIPPTGSVPAAIWLVAGLVVGAGYLSLLPADLFQTPGWRHALLAEGGFGPLDHVSVAPEATLFWLAILAGSLVVGMYLLSQPARAAGLVWLAAAASLFCAGYAGMAIFAEARGWRPAFDAGGTFGFFPNRNHVSTLLVTGALAGIGALAGGIERRNVPAALAGAAGLAVCGWTVLLESPSRGGVVILVLGVGLWLLGLGRGRVTLPVLVTSGALAVAALVFFLGTNNPASRRLTGAGPASQVEKFTEDFRLQIYRDSVRMLADFPLTGTGLGTYRFLYPWYADASMEEATALHPESDWLMAAIEAGPVAVAGFAALLLLAALRAYSLRKDGSWTVRWALISAAAAAVAHGILDVPLHRVELGWWVLTLGCLGLGRPESDPARRGSWQRWAFAASGVLLGLLGWRLVAAQWFGGEALPPFAPKAAAEKILTVYKAGQEDMAFFMAEAESARWPLDADLRYQLGVLGLLFEETDARSDAAFRAARLLSPVWPQIPLDEGNALFPSAPRRAAQLWLDATDRQARIDRRQKRAGEPGMGIYAGILTRLRADPENLQLVMPPDDFDPALHLAWIQAAADPRARIRQLAGNPSFRGRLKKNQRAEFLSLWSSRGEPAALDEFLRANPDWEGDAWGARVKALVATGDYAGAVEVLRKRFSVKLDPPAASDGAGHDLEAECAAFAAARNDVAARRILAEAARSGGERAALAHRLQAAIAAKNGDWALAYKELIAHLQASEQNLSPIL